MKSNPDPIMQRRRESVNQVAATVRRAPSRTLARSIAIALGLSACAIAADGIWTGTAGGNWSDPAQWSAATIADGTLLVNAPGSLIAASAVTVNSGGTLGGSGTINGPVTVVAGGILSPAAAAPVTLTVNHTVTLAGTALFRVDRSLYPNCGRIASSSSITYGGTLKVVNHGPALQLGDKLQLFTASAFNGGFSSILLPPLGYNLMWDTGRLAVDGSVAVVSGAALDHPVITLTPGTFYQQILGSGGNFCQGEQNTLVNYQRYDEMFGPDGLNMSFIRLSTAHELAEPGFAAFDANNIPTIREFRARQPYGRVMLTTWTPPEALKSTNSPYQGTLAKNAGGQYRYADYGAWWTRALQFYQANAVLPDYVSIQNEPDFTPTPPSGGSIPAYIAGCYLNSSETPLQRRRPRHHHLQRRMERHTRVRLVGQRPGNNRTNPQRQRHLAVRESKRTARKYEQALRPPQDLQAMTRPANGPVRP